MNRPEKASIADASHGVAAIQRLAFGGIANPTQRAVLRGSDATYLTARQRELDAFEEQRQSYNTALQDFQTNVYEPYKAKSAAYNTAAEKYNWLNSAVCVGYGIPMKLPNGNNGVRYDVYKLL